MRSRPPGRAALAAVLHESSLSIDGLIAIIAEIDPDRFDVCVLVMSLKSVVAAAKSGSVVSMGIEHASYNHRVKDIPPEIKQSLIADLH